MVLFSKLQSIDTSCHEYFHPYDPSCSNMSIWLTKDALLESFRIYVVAYSIGLLVRRKLPSSRDVQKTILGIIQSTAFLTTNATVFSMFVCFLRRIFGDFNFLSVAFLPCVLASYVAINVERPSRRNLLCLYVTNVASETLFRMAVARKLVKPLIYGDVIIFSLSIAQLLYFFRGDHISSDPIYGFLRFLVGPCEERGYERREAQPETESLRYTGKNILLKTYCNIRSKVQGLLSSIPPHPTCPHPATCLQYITRDGARMFLLGYGIQLCLKLVVQQRRIMRNPSKLTQILFSMDTMRLGAVFSSFNVIFKGVMCLLRHKTGVDDQRFAYPAGALAGLSFILFRDNTIALYFMWKTFNVIYNKGISKGYLWNVPYSTEILYSISTAVLFHAGILEPDALRPSYWRFLKAISGNRLETMDRRPLEVFGFGTLGQLDKVLNREKTHKK